MSRNPVGRSHLRIGATLVLLFLSCQGCGHRSTPPLEPYIEAELFRLEEAYRILDLYGEELWPGWTNYTAIPVKVNFPNGVVLLVTRSKPLPDYERVPRRTIYGKSVYVNRKNQTPIEVRPPLLTQRGRGGTAIELDMAQPDLPSPEAERSAALEARLKEVARPETPFDLSPLGDSDSQVLMYVHELFHGHQSRFPQFQGALPADALLRRYQVSAEYAAWSHIEGLALRSAYVEPQDAAALDLLKDFAVARGIKRALMPRGTAAAEARISLKEGAASYVSLKAALLLRDAADKAGLDRAKDPFFYNYAYLDAYINNVMNKGLDFAVAWTDDKQGKYYLYGAYQCFLLDRFSPGWKKGFFEKNKNLDAKMADLLKISESEREEIKRRLPVRYGYNEILAFHENALQRQKSP
jgi:hypothetical protein